MAQDRQLQDQQETIRIPVYGQDNYDPFGVSLDQTFINCFPEIIKDSTTGEGEVRVVKREGLATAGVDLFTISGAANRSDIYPMAHIVVSQLDDVYVCALGDVTASKIYIVQYRPLTGTSVLVGTLSSVSYLDYIHLSECQISSTGIKAGITVVWTKQDRSVSKCYWAVGDGTKLTTASLTQITNVAFPDQQTPAKIVTGPMQQMNGIFYAFTTDGTIYNSGSTTGTENNATSWSTLSNILTYQYPDGGIGLYRYKHHLIAVGKDSIEFFNDIGNPPPASRLERTEQAFIKFGAISPLCVLNVDDTMYWVSYGTTNTIGLWKLEGYTPVKVSTGKQDARLLFNITGTVLPLTRVWMYPIVFQNKKHIGITNITISSSLITANISNFLYGNALDTYYLSGYQTTGAEANGTNLMYNVEDKVWWAFKFAPWSGTSLLPVTNFPGYAGSSNKFYLQYILMADQSTGGSSISGCRVLKLASGAANTYADYNPDGVVGADGIPVPMFLQLNTLDFSNLHKKRISRATVVFTSVPVKASGDTNVYSMSLFINKKNLSDGTLSLERTVNYPNAQHRYYWNNLGTGRSWSFCIAHLSKDPVSIKALDLMVHQGTH